MRSQITEKVLDHVIFTGRQEVYKDVIKNTYVCDVCGKETNGVSTCLGCDKDFCYTCADHYHDSMAMIHREYEVGSAEDCWDNGYEPASEDYRFIKFHLCRSCCTNPPKKISLLIGKIKELEQIQRDKERVTNEIIDEVEKLEKK